MQNRPTFKQVKLIFAKTLLALEDLRRVGLVHNDLKSDNIMICKNSIVKVIDFSLSSHFRDGYLNDSLFGKAVSNGVWTPAIDYFYLGIAFYQLHAYMTIPFFYSSDIANELYFPFETKNDQFVELKTPHVYFHWDFFNVLKPLLETDWIKRVGRDYHSVLKYRFNTPTLKTSTGMQ
ncbi:kinase-like protein [Rozella allomycis CSF55]|uniref:Kinase-like protein n=1 Tax=Rozella allomycis (strain CSF55) TaxID=988480 RepID=A0A4P9YAB7_ROZAC|nr:kinase-like protein [Rozella allomycis CSF55]